MGHSKSDIVEQAGQLFMRCGIRSVNMDDVSKHLHISKKTLYQFVKDKNDLVEEVIEGICSRNNSCIIGICDRGLNAIDEQYEITSFLVGLIRQFHPSIHYDLEKYHPHAWTKLKGIQQEHIMKCMTANLEKGKKDGLYRKDLDVNIVVRIYLSRFDVVFDGVLFPPEQFSFEGVLWEMFSYHVHGIASLKGAKYLEDKVKELKNK